MKEANLDKILAENPQLDGQRIAELANARQHFQDIGHDLRPKYRVEPAFSALASVAFGSSADSAARRRQR